MCHSDDSKFTKLCFTISLFIDIWILIPNIIFEFLILENFIYQYQKFKP